ncbi:MAG: hypothetical protein HC836_50355, partial [Richelia sp. RM2_1_2]|nr:hypothetical protein [Richelia sp. RM2_1_2]
SKLGKQLDDHNFMVKDWNELTEDEKKFLKKINDMLTDEDKKKLNDMLKKHSPEKSSNDQNQMAAGVGEGNSIWTINQGKINPKIKWRNVIKKWFWKNKNVLQNQSNGVSS